MDVAGELTGIPEDQLDSSPRDSPATDPSGAPGLKKVGKERDDVEAGRHGGIVAWEPKRSDLGEYPSASEQPPLIEERGEASP